MASKNRSDGEGSIYFDKTRDKWVGVFVIGWRDGKPIRKKVSAASKAGAASKLRALREGIEAGALPKGRVPTTGEWLTYWLDNIVAERNRPNTIRTYKTYVNGYLIPLLGHHRLDRLSVEHVEAAWRRLMSEGNPGKPDAKPLSTTSVHQAHVILSRALKIAQRRGLLYMNVAALGEAPSVRHQEIEILEEAQAKKVIAAAAGKRNAARYTVAFSLGLRQGEALALRWHDVDLDNGVLYVRHSLSRVTGQGLQLGPTKSAKGTRAIALPKPLLAELKAHRKAQNTDRLAAGSRWDDADYVFTTHFGRPVDPKDDWTHWRDLLAEAKVPHVRLHAARHTAATMLLAQGVPQRVVMEILGHSKSSQTEGYQKRVDALHVAAAESMAAFWD
jgi:integrase